MGDVNVGKKVDGYHIQEVLGRGGMGVVYKAKDTALSRTVALKCLNPNLAGDEAFLRRFRSEARAIARINSPYIVQIYILKETEIGLVIVMEYVDGQTLKQYVTASETDWKESLPLIQQMLTALQHAHAGGVVHRDIKPENILLSDKVFAHGNRVKMTDFGLAKINTTGKSRTVTQGVYGTLHYMSPEQVEGHGEVDHRSDLYSLGMTCYEMLAGRLPFEDDSSEYTIMQSIVEGDLPEIGSFVPDVPPPLREIVMKAVARDPKERFQSASEMKEALTELDAASKHERTVQERARGSIDPGSPGGRPLRQHSSGEISTLERGTSDDNSESANRATSTPVWKMVGGGVFLTIVVFSGWVFLSAPSLLSTSVKLFHKPSASGSEASPANASSEGSLARALRTEEDSLLYNVGETSVERSLFTKSDLLPQFVDERNTTGSLTDSLEKKPSKQDAGEQTDTSDENSTEPVEEVDSQAGQVDIQTTGQESEGRQAAQPDIPTSIGELLNIKDPKVLYARLREKEGMEKLRSGRGTRLEEYTSNDIKLPRDSYIFLVNLDEKVEAVLGPEISEGTRIELRSRRKIDRWTHRYQEVICIPVLLTDE